MYLPNKTTKLGTYTAIAAVLAGGYVQSVRAAPGDLIGTPIMVGSTNTDSPISFAPSVGSDAAGNSVVTWIDTDGNLLARRYAKDGTVLGSDVAIAQQPASGIGSATNPVVAVNASGQFVVTWAHESRPHVWTLPLPIIGPLFSYTRFPTTLHARTFTADGTPISGDVRVASMPYSYNNCCGPTFSAAVAIDDDGDFVVNWVANRRSLEEYHPLNFTSHSGVYARVYDAGGKPKSALLTIDAGTLTARTSSGNDVTTYTGHSSDTSDVGMDSAGNFTIVWNAGDVSATSNSNNIYGHSYSLGGKALGDKFQINTSAGASGSILAMNGSGEYVVLWAGCGSITCARRYAPGNEPVSGEIAVADDLTGETVFPLHNKSVAMDVKGDFLVVFPFSVGCCHSTGYLRLFDSAGSPLSASVPLEQPSYDFKGFGTAMDAAGDAVAAYFGDRAGDGTSLQPVLLQRVAGP